MLNHGGFSAYQWFLVRIRWMHFCSRVVTASWISRRNPRRAANMSQSGSYRKKQVQDPILESMTISKLRRLLVRNKTFQRPKVEVCDSGIFYSQVAKKNAPKWRDPAAVLDIDNSGKAVKFQSQTFKVGRFCFRKRQELQGGLNVDPDGSARTTAAGCDRNVQAGGRDVGGGSLPGGDMAPRGAAPRPPLFSSVCIRIGWG